MIGPHREEDFPWTFYFNGEALPKWGACWMLAGIIHYLQEEDYDNEYVSHRDIVTIYTRIDHVGAPESADPDVFIYAIQEVLCVLLSNRDAIFTTLNEKKSLGQPEEIYSGLIEKAVRMRTLALEQHRAFWTSGYDTDRAYLVERMRRSQLSPESPEFALPPHVHWRQSELRLLQEEQIRRLHKLAQSGQLNKELSARLQEIRAA